MVDCYAVLSKDLLVNSEMKISYYDTFKQKYFNIILDVNPEGIIDHGDDDSIFKLAAREHITHLERVKLKGQESDGNLF